MVVRGRHASEGTDATPNHRNLGHGRFYSAVFSAMRWSVSRGCETRQKEAFRELPVRAARCSVCDVGGKGRAFGLLRGVRARLDVAASRLRGCSESLLLSECVRLSKKENAIITCSQSRRADHVRWCVSSPSHGIYAGLRVDGASAIIHNRSWSVMDHPAKLIRSYFKDSQ